MEEPIYESSLDGQLSCLIEDSSIGLKGFIVIDSNINGRSVGGVRIMEDTSLEELKNLARGMTLKSGFLGLPLGGSKGAVIADGENLSREEKIKLLKRFVEIVKPLVYEKRYRLGPDMNTSASEIATVNESIGEKVVKRLHVDSGYYTALSVLVTALESAQLTGIDFRSSTTVIEGFGSVGSNVARLFSERGSKIVAVSTSSGAIYNQNGLNVKELLALKQKYGNKFVLQKWDWKKIPLYCLLELPCDLLVPAALGRSINTRNASKIEAKVVCPGANIPVTFEAERILTDRGILSVPFFVSNCGGVLGNSMQFWGIPPRKIEIYFFQHLADRYRKALQLIIPSSDYPRKIMEDYALKNFSKVKRRAETKSLKNTIFWHGVRVFKSTKIIPKLLVQAVSERYFREKLEAW